MKERVTLTIEANLLRQIDATVDGNTIRNRSHAVELLVREAIKGSLPEQAVVLAGGSTQAVDYVLQQVGGQPVIKHNIDLLLDAGVQHILIITKEPERIQEVLGDLEEANIQYVTETHSLGTAGALNLAQPYIEGTFILTNADDKKTLDLTSMYDFHQQNNGLCTIALTSTDEPSKYGVALLNGNRIVTFVEKPSKDKSPSNLISAGMYFMEPEALKMIPQGYGRIEYDLFPKLAKEDKLYGYPFSGEYEHYGPHTS